MMFVIGNYKLNVYHCSPILSHCLYSQITCTKLIKNYLLWKQKPTLRKK